MITLAGGGVEEEDLKKKKKKEQGVCRLGKEHLFFWTSKKQNKQNSNNCFEYQQPRSLVGPSLCGYCLAPSVLLSQRLVPMPMPTQGPRRIKVTNPDQTDACVETMAVWAGPRGSGARTAVSSGVGESTSDYKEVVTGERWIAVFLLFEWYF